MRTLARLVLVCGLIVSASACGSVTSPSELIAVDFSGTLNPLGTATQGFSVGKTGEMQLTLQSLTPRPVVGFLTLAIGSFSGTSCTPLAAYYVTQAGIGQQYAFSQITSGSYCIYLSDNNSILTQPVTFAVHLLHP